MTDVLSLEARARQLFAILEADEDAEGVAVLRDLLALLATRTQELEKVQVNLRSILACDAGNRAEHARVRAELEQRTQERDEAREEIAMVCAASLATVGPLPDDLQTALERLHAFHHEFKPRVQP